MVKISSITRYSLRSTGLGLPRSNKVQTFWIYYETGILSNPAKFVKPQLRTSCAVSPWSRLMPGPLCIAVFPGSGRDR